MNHTSPFGPMSGPVAESKSPTIRENVPHVAEGQIRVGGVAFRAVVRVGQPYWTNGVKTKWRLQIQADSGEWVTAPSHYTKTVVTRWPDVEE